jgi:hypothetical protein
MNHDPFQYKGQSSLSGSYPSTQQRFTDEEHQIRLDYESRILIVVKESFDISTSIDILNQMFQHTAKKILYISFVHSYIHLKKNIISSPLEGHKLFIVDCVSQLLVQNLKDSSDVVFRDPPQSVTQMKQLLSETIHIGHSNVIVIDSFSQFLNYSKSSDIQLQELFLFLQDKQSENFISQETKILLFFNPSLNSPVSIADIEQHFPFIKIVYL